MTGQRRTVYKGRIIDLYLENITLPNGTDVDMEIVDHPGGAAVVALDDAGRVCLLRQYRHVAGGYIWELPAGKIDDCEPPLDTARRELRDEAGITAGQWQSLGDMLSSPGVFAEVIHLWLARDLQIEASNSDADEVIEVHWTPWRQAIAMTLAGDIRDGKTIAGLMRASQHVSQP